MDVEYVKIAVDWRDPEGKYPNFHLYKETATQNIFTTFSELDTLIPDKPKYTPRYYFLRTKLRKQLYLVKEHPLIETGVVKGWWRFNSKWLVNEAGIRHFMEKFTALTPELIELVLSP